MKILKILNIIHEQVLISIVYKQTAQSVARHLRAWPHTDENNKGINTFAGKSIEIDKGAEMRFRCFVDYFKGIKQSTNI